MEIHPSLRKDCYTTLISPKDLLHLSIFLLYTMVTVTAILLLPPKNTRLIYSHISLATISATIKIPISPELFSPTPTNNITKDNWLSPPLSPNNPHVLGKDNLHNYLNLASTNESCDEHSSVGTPPVITQTTGLKKKKD